MLADSLTLKSDGANCKDDLHSFFVSLKSLKTARVDVSLTPVFGEHLEATSTKDQQIMSHEHPKNTNPVQNEGPGSEKI